MQATVGTTWFGINRIKLTLVAAGILVTGVTATAALGLTDVGGDEASSAARDIAVVEPAKHPMDRGGIHMWKHGTSQASTDTTALEANGLPTAPNVVQAQSSDTADLEANGLPIAPVTASDDAIWHAFPGHPGFTASEGEEPVSLTRTYYPGHAGFTP